MAFGRGVKLGFAAFKRVMFELTGWEGFLWEKVCSGFGVILAHE